MVAKDLAMKGNAVSIEIAGSARNRRPGSLLNKTDCAASEPLGTAALILRFGKFLHMTEYI
jgi:hypothetical protein